MPMDKKPKTYKPRRVLRDLESKCDYGKDMTRQFVKRIYEQLGLELDY